MRGGGGGNGWNIIVKIENVKMSLLQQEFYFNTYANEKKQG